MTMSCILIGVIVIFQLGLALGNFFMRPPPRASAAKAMLFMGIILAGLVLAQFFWSRHIFEVALNKELGKAVGLMGGGSL